MGINSLIKKMPASTSKTVAKKPSKNKNVQAKFPKSYKEMIKDCLKANEERTGLSAHQLKTYIKDTYKNEAQVKLFNKALKGLVSGIEINQKKGHYKMTKEQKANKKVLA